MDGDTDWKDGVNQLRQFHIKKEQEEPNIAAITGQNKRQGASSRREGIDLEFLGQNMQKI